jgi:hypothetical protein
LGWIEIGEKCRFRHGENVVRQKTYDLRM